jgi:Bacterial Ig domain
LTATSSQFGLELATPIAAGHHFFFLGRDSTGGIELFAQENERPLASDDTATVAGGSTVAIDVLANDRDTDGSLDAASIRIVTQPIGGTVVVSGGTVSYSARSDFSGTDSFSYAVADTQGRESAGALVTIQVSPGPSAPPSRGGGGAMGLELLALLLLWIVRAKQAPST